ncbi:MAG: glycosyltransferase family 8 protein [Lachnospiraceae bacterium]|nr:glycosyltransferase family 8 protein [Lachnospiraceae bacterium]
MQINLAMSFNKVYVKYAYVMLTSVFENQKEGTNINLTVLHSDLGFEEQKMIKDLVCANGGQVNYVFVNTEMFPTNIPTTVDWTIETYYRLILPEFLPEEMERVLYIDADVIVNGPLDELYSEAFEDNVLCACDNFGMQNFEGQNFGPYRRRMFSNHFERGLTYVNPGMMIMNLKLLRKLCNLETYIDVARQFDFNLEMLDMDLINYVHAGHIRVLDKYKYHLLAMQSYNEGIRYDSARMVTVVHYAGHKPWQGEGPRYDIEQIWWDYAVKTPFYNEFTAKFVYECINSSYNYDKIRKLTEEKMLLNKELEMRKQLCDKLLMMVENGKEN